MAPTVQKKSSSCPSERGTEKKLEAFNKQKVKEKSQQQRSQMLCKTLALVLLLELRERKGSG